MTPLISLANFIDRISRSLGLLTAWLTLTMTLLGALNALARYAGRFLGVELSSNAYLELQWYLFAMVFLLGAAETLREQGHVRVDVLYARFPPRMQRLLDLFAMLALLLPFCGVGFWMSLPSVQSSWAVLEQSPDPGGLPRYPIKTLLPIAFVILGLQGIAQALKDVVALVSGPQAVPPLTPPETPTHG